ncbi:MAG: histidine phosphatase family protein, partial [Clostridia bacterium]|nr:histidine phosphatase family protein [Clostridia bacterium]
RKICDTYVDDFPGFAEMQWADFEYKLETGECLREVQERNINALKDVLKRFEGKNIAIGTHGTALSTIVNYYDKSFGYTDFMKIRRVLPWIVVMTFENGECKGIEQYRLNWERM